MDVIKRSKQTNIKVNNKDLAISPCYNYNEENIQSTVNEKHFSSLQKNEPNLSRFLEVNEKYL